MPFMCYWHRHSVWMQTLSALDKALKVGKEFFKFSKFDICVWKHSRLGRNLYDGLGRDSSSWQNPSILLVVIWIVSRNEIVNPLIMLLLPGHRPRFYTARWQCHSHRACNWLLTEVANSANCLANPFTLLSFYWAHWGHLGMLSSCLSPIGSKHGLAFSVHSELKGVVSLVHNKNEMGMLENIVYLDSLSVQTVISPI